MFLEFLKRAKGPYNHFVTYKCQQRNKDYMLSFEGLPDWLRLFLLTLLSQAFPLGGGALLGSIVPKEMSWDILSALVMAFVSGMMFKGGLPKIEDKWHVLWFFIGACAVVAVSTIVKHIYPDGTGMGLLIGCLVDGFTETLLMGSPKASKYFLLFATSNLPEGFAAGHAAGNPWNLFSIENPVLSLALGGFVLALLAAFLGGGIIKKLNITNLPDRWKNRLECFGGGAIIATAANSILPKAYNSLALWKPSLGIQLRARYFTGLAVVIGVLAGVGIDTLTESEVDSDVHTLTEKTMKRS